MRMKEKFNQNKEYPCLRGDVQGFYYDTISGDDANQIIFDEDEGRGKPFDSLGEDFKKRFYEELEDAPNIDLILKSTAYSKFIGDMIIVLDCEIE